MGFDRTIDPGRLLHRALLKQVETWPDASAVVTGPKALTYGELGRRAVSLAGQLHALRIKPSTPVAVVMERGWEAVVGAFGVLLAGAAYAPIEVGGPVTDLSRALQDVDADVVVTQPGLVGKVDFGRKRKVVVVERAADATPLLVPLSPDEGRLKGSSLACLMSRPDPRGGHRRVKVTHAQLAAVVGDFTAQTRIDGRDRVMSLDTFDAEAFTCCVWSTLVAGGAVVLPLGDERYDPTRWLELVDDYDVTVWSSTPAAMQRLVAERQANPAFSLSTLRLAALEGEWMPVRLPGEIEKAIPGARLAAFHSDLDDAAQAGRRLEILDPVWTSAPYRRRPTAGQDFTQRFHVLSGGLEDCAPLVPGDLYVGTPTAPAAPVTRWPFGRSVSVKRPNSGESLVRTGYRARRRPDGGIEFTPWLDRKTYAVPPAPPVWWARARA